MKSFKIQLFLSTVSIFALFFQLGCKKQNEWLDIKRNKSDVVPQTFSDFQAILDNTTYLTNGFSSSTTIGSDNLYVSDANLNSLAEPERNLYLWNKNIWINDSSFDWNTYYTMVEYSNIVLDGLHKLSNGAPEYNDVKGQSLFWRSYAFYQLAQTFGQPYNSDNATATLGIPIRTSSDVNITFERSNTQTTFNKIVEDLIQSSALLPLNTKYNTRPTKLTAMALLARVYLNMGNYAQAFLYSDSTLKENGTLLDFNSSLIQLSSTYRFPANGLNNPEILLFAQGGGYNSANPTTSALGFVDLELYNSYSPNDLRKTIFFVSGGTPNLFKIRGTYSGNNVLFFGVATNEMYLIRAECNARAGKISEAMADLNLLLKNRYKAGFFLPLVANSPEEALKIILDERRKELAFVGSLRWEDLRRLNQDVKFARSITRLANGVNYSLRPNDPKYVYPIPENEVQLTRIQQNNR